MSLLRRTAQAERDLEDIWLWVAADDPAAADRLLDRLEAVSRLLAANPDLGAARDDIAPGLRLFPVRRYLILHRRIEGGVEVVRYVHGARDLPGLALG